MISVYIIGGMLVCALVGFSVAIYKGVSIVSLDGSANYYGDSAIKGRFNNVSGAIRPLLLQVYKNLDIWEEEK